jgi:DNA-binding Lrp family transcriptional regulator
LDKLDVRIIREYLQGEPLLTIWSARQNPKPALKILSDKLGVAESTVRARNKKISAFFPEWSFQPNPSLFGEKMGGFFFDLPENIQKGKVLEELKLIDDILIIVNFHGPMIQVAFFFDDERSFKRKMDLISKISGTREINSTVIPFPICNITLSKTDLQIVASLQEDARKSNQRVSEELGVSSKTVKRRMIKMVSQGAVWPVAELNVGALSDCAYANLSVIFKGPEFRAETEREIAELLNDYLIFNGHFVSFNTFHIIVPSITLAASILQKVTSLSGVMNARVDFIEEWFGSYEILKDKVNGKIREMNYYN